MAQVLFDLENTDHAVCFVEEGGFALPEGAKSDALFRYILEDDVVVDRFAGKSDEEATTEFQEMKGAELAAALARVDEQKRAEDAVITRLQFLRRLTQSERIRLNAANDPIVADFLMMINNAESIDLFDSDTVDGVGYIETKGYVEAGRAAKILAV